MLHYITADLHYRLRTYTKYRFLDDVKRSSDFILKHMHSQNEDKSLIVSGDIYDVCNPSSGIHDAVIKLFDESLNITDHVLVLLGNHDNNDSDKDALAPLESACNDTYKGIKVVRDIEIVKMGRTKFFCFPHLSRKLLYKVVPPSTSYNDAVAEYVKHKGLSHKDADVIIGHMLVQGAKYGSENILLREQAYKRNAFKDKLCFLGHIHKPQQIGDNCYYVGSPVITDFSERDEEKRFMVYDDESGTVNSILIPTPRWIQVGLDLSKKHEVSDTMLKDIKKDDRVKLDIKTTETTYYKVDVNDIIEKVENKGGQVLTYKVERTDKIRKMKDSEEIAEGGDFIKNITSMIKKYINTNFDESKEIKSLINKICIDSMDVNKYSHVTEGVKLQLNSVRIVNMFSYRDETIHFPEGLTGILGDNGVGKSSIVDAILYAITGEERGEKAGCSKNTAADPKDPMEVTLDINIGKDKVKAIRGRKKSGPYAELSLNEEDKPDTVGETAVTNRLIELMGVNYNTLVNTSVFREEFQDAFLKAKPTPREEYVRDHYGLGFIKDAYDNIHATYREKKSDLEYELKSLKGYESELDNMDKNDLDVRLANWTKKLEEVNNKINDNKADLEKVLKLETKVEELEETEADYTELKEQIDQTEALVKEYSELKDLSSDIDEKKKAIKDLEKLYNAQADVADACEDEIIKVKAEKEVFEKGNLDCPIFKVKISEKCNIFKNQLKGGDLDETLKEFDKKVDAEQKKLDKADALCKDYTKKLDDLEEELPGLERKQKKYEEAQDYITKSKEKLKESKSKLKKISEKLVEMKNMKAELCNSETIKRAIKELEDQKEEAISEKTSVEKDLDEFNKIKKTIKQIKTKIKTLEIDEKVYKIAETVFSKNGVVVAILDYICSMIGEWTNHLLERLSEEYVAVDLQKTSKGITVMVDWDGSQKEYIMYSGGERTLINFAVRFGFSMALSNITGFVPSVLILDEVLGKLDENNRMGMMSIVRYIGEKGFKQVLMITHTVIKDYLNQVIRIGMVNKESKVIE